MKSKKLEGMLRDISFAEQALQNPDLSEQGHFHTPKVRDLMLERGGGDIKLTIMHGVNIISDIGTLQGYSKPNSMFQVASQYNCLEALSPYDISEIPDYLFDNTQGPRACVSAYPGAFLRYEINKQQPINLLNINTMNGYLLPEFFNHDQFYSTDLYENRVGIHIDTPVKLGSDWAGIVPDDVKINQVFSSCLAAGYSKVNTNTVYWYKVMYDLLYLSYFSALLAATHLNNDRIFLTLVGGGVFKNPDSLIWRAIDKALHEIKPYLGRDLQVVINMFNNPMGKEATRVIKSHKGKVIDVLLY